MYIRRTYLPVSLIGIFSLSARKLQKDKHRECSQHNSSLVRKECLSFTQGSSGAALRRHSRVLKTLLPAVQKSSLCLLTTLTARRFSTGAGIGRRPTYTEISEACSVLGVEVDCDTKQLKKVYRDLVKKNHPDAGGDEVTMSRITVAYDRLSGLSPLERQQFKLQRDAFRGGSYYAAASEGNDSRGRHGSSSSSSGGYYRTNTGNPMYGHRGSGHTNGFYDSTKSEFFNQGHAGHRGHYTYQQQGRSYTDNPFTASHPFSFNSQLRRAWGMSMSSILLRGFVVYLGISVVFLLLYRRYRDWVHDDGWKMSESLARHEQLSEMHRIRQEWNERIRAAREAAAAHSTTARAVVNRGDGNTDYNTVTTSGERELRALEYARRRQMTMGEEFRGWPQFSEEKGKLILRAQDPPGVVFFEPRKEDHLQRQLLTLQKGRERSERNQNAAEARGKSYTANETVTVPVTDVNVAASTTAGVDADVLSSINAILGGVWRGEEKRAGN